ncbi:MAG: RNA 2',3'-cyclic phosphodiesterase [Nocardiopsaceae bacterium]|jgi:2'-5' RNA ligase|nr:RNA 2',3'-cyclic phosphodiesterase [Nocardiopsaceae bacterium]
MRLFVALTPPPGALAELDAVVAPFRPDWPGLRWASVDRWHVTLAFLGQVDESRVDGLRERLERAAGRHHALRLRVGRGGAFPSARRARVLCAHIAGEAAALDGLRALAATVAAGARRAGAPPPDEGRRYRPHLTLARCRQPSDVKSLVDSLSGFSGEIWDATEVELILSKTGPQPSYQTIGNWPLRR